LIIYADPGQTAAGRLVTWVRPADEAFESAVIGFRGGNVQVAPYGFSVAVIVQKSGASISGTGSVEDPYYDDKSTRAVNTLLEAPSVADMKLDWQVVLESPGFYNDIESKYFALP
jgi:hypothetical protein